MEKKELMWDYEIEGKDFRNAGRVSSKVKDILKELGFDPDFVRRVAIASYEAEMNVVCHADKGTLHFAILPQALQIVVKDRGPGIPDIELAMQEGYSTAPPEIREMGFGAGMGLSNMKKNADELHIVSTVGQGTVVEMVMRSPRSRQGSA
ncbi:MAG: anti-sigma regulatory factor [Deltaproteobacteria bacterium RBG_16_54_18]|jgi:serine/threonine-protein kinase RsbT|nr:MAG: anti-sigma regulatory factor [Deltaproteobacteria bacterium RBG_16_54_18]